MVSRVSAKARNSCRSGVSAASFKDVTDFLRTECQ